MFGVEDLGYWVGDLEFGVAGVMSGIEDLGVGVEEFRFGVEDS